MRFTTRYGIAGRAESVLTVRNIAPEPCLLVLTVI